MDNKKCIKCEVELNIINWPPDKYKKGHKICYSCCNLNSINKRLNNKIKLINEYGGKCIECDEKNIIFLTIDHINSNGATQKRELKNNGDLLYLWLKRNNYPKDNYQLLCFNCNYNKYFIEKCNLFVINNIDTNVIKNDSSCSRCGNFTDKFYNKYYCNSCNRVIHNLSNFNLKKLTMDKYGNVCVCCGENNINILTIDHINNDGAIERNKLLPNRNYLGEKKGGGGNTFYRWLKRNGFPKENYQILCFNCNFAKHNLGTCPHQLTHPTPNYRDSNSPLIITT